MTLKSRLEKLEKEVSGKVDSYLQEVHFHEEGKPCAKCEAMTPEEHEAWQRAMHGRVSIVEIRRARDRV